MRTRVFNAELVTFVNVTLPIEASVKFRINNCQSKIGMWEWIDFIFRFRWGGMIDFRKDQKKLQILANSPVVLFAVVSYE